MKCYICDRDLGPTEVQLRIDGRWECCGTCLTIAIEAAYSGEYHELLDSDLPVKLLDEFDDDEGIDIPMCSRGPFEDA